jgi:hypothetical protein
VTDAVPVGHRILRGLSPVIVDEMEHLVECLVLGLFYLCASGYETFGVVGLIVFLVFVLVVAFFAGRKQATSEFLNSLKEHDRGEEFRD